MAWVAPGLGAAAALAGFFVGNAFDLPPAHAAVALLAAAVALTWLRRRS
jgi:ABC-type Mn2+/Zn2+ transport system permease subunit